MPNKKVSQEVDSIQEMISLIGETKTKKFIKSVFPDLSIDGSMEQIIARLDQMDQFMQSSIQNGVDYILERFNGNFHK